MRIPVDRLALKLVAKVDILAVPFKGGAETNAAVLGNHTMLQADSTGWRPLVDAGKRYKFAVTKDGVVAIAPLPADLTGPAGVLVIDFGTSPRLRQISTVPPRLRRPRRRLLPDP